MASILFLDIDGVLQPFNTNGWNLDPVACELVEAFCELTQARIVLCSDRAIQYKECYRALARAGISPRRFQGSCRPVQRPAPGETSKTQRVIEYLGQESVSVSTSFVIIDDDRSFMRHPRLGERHVLPLGAVLQEADLIAARRILAGG